MGRVELLDRALGPELDGGADREVGSPPGVDDAGDDGEVAEAGDEAARGAELGAPESALAVEGGARWGDAMHTQKLRKRQAADHRDKSLATT